MADVYLWDETVGASSVVLRTSAAVVETVTAGGGGRIKYQTFPPRFRRLTNLNDDDEVLISALI